MDSSAFSRATDDEDDGDPLPRSSHHSASSELEGLVVVRRRRGEAAEADPCFAGVAGAANGRKRFREPRRFLWSSSSRQNKTVQILIRTFLCSMFLFPLYIRKTGRWDNEGSWSIGLVRVPPSSSDKENDFFGRCSSHLPLSPSLTYQDVEGARGATFVADPFLYFPPSDDAGKKGETVHLFAEVKHAPTPGWRGKPWVFDGKGDIGMSTSRDFGRTWGPIRLVLRERFHLSYPFVFDDSEDGGERRMFLIPESNQANSIRLYEASDPTDLESSHWTLRRILLSGERFVDNTLLYRDGRWWLFTLVDGRLRLFYTRKAGRNERRSDVLLDPYRSDRDDESEEGDQRSDGWTEHPLSPLGPEQGVVVPRPAGRIFSLRSSFGGKKDEATTTLHYYRPAQDGTDGYGRYVRTFRIETLNVMDYMEVEETRGIGPTPLSSTPRKEWMGRRVHHFDVHRVPQTEGGGGGGFLVAFDGDGGFSGTLAVFAIAAVVVWGLALAVAMVWSNAATRKVGLIMTTIRNSVSARIPGRRVRTAIAVAATPVVLAYAVLVYRLRTEADNTMSLKPTPTNVWGDRAIGERHIEGNSEKAQSDDICRATLVTSMFDLGRADFSGSDPREARSFDKYLSWFEDVLSLRSCLVVYVEESTVPFVWDVRNSVLGTDLARKMTVVKVMSVDDLRSHPHAHYPQIRGVVDDASYVSSVRRPGRPEMRIPEYNALMYSKVTWLNETIFDNPFKSDLFFSVDGGYGHGEKLTRMRNLTWPDPVALGRRIHPDKLFIVHIRNYDPAIDCDDETLDLHARRHRSVVMGAFFGGTSDAIRRFAFNFEKQLTKQLDERGIMDDEQQIIFGVKCRHPSLIDLHVCKRHPFCVALGIQPCWDSWHCPINMFEPPTAAAGNAPPSA